MTVPRGVQRTFVDQSRTSGLIPPKGFEPSRRERGPSRDVLDAASLSRLWA